MIYLKLFLIFFKIGAFTFGGGYAMLPLIQQEVLSQGWMDLEQLVNFIAVSESTPGPLAVNLSTYIGAETGGLLGSFCATVGVVLPSFVIILLVAKFYQAFQTNTLVKGCMNGLRPTVVGMIGASLLSVGASAFPAAGGVMQWVLAAVLLAAILVAHWKKVHPIVLIVGSAVVGIAAGYAGLAAPEERPRLQGIPQAAGVFLWDVPFREKGFDNFLFILQVGLFSATMKRGELCRVACSPVNYSERKAGISLWSSQNILSAPMAARRCPTTKTRGTSPPLPCLPRKK